MFKGGSSPEPQNRWKQLILVIVEITLFLAAWILLFLGIFRGYFAIILILALGVMIFLSFHDKSEGD